MSATELLGWKHSHGFDSRTNISPEIIDHLVSCAKRGLPMTLACKSIGVKYKTFKDWQQHYVDHEDSPYRLLFQPVYQAHMEKVGMHLDRITEHGKYAKQWPANAWIIQHMHPEEFADPKTLLERSQEHAPKIVVQIGTVEHLNLTDILQHGTDKAVIDAEILGPSQLPSQLTSQLPSQLTESWSQKTE